jgi:hypothetical protein
MFTNDEDYIQAEASPSKFHSSSGSSDISDSREEEHKTAMVSPVKRPSGFRITAKRQELNRSVSYNGSMLDELSRMSSKANLSPGKQKKNKGNFSIKMEHTRLEGIAAGSAYKPLGRERANTGASS